MNPIKKANVLNTNKVQRSSSQECKLHQKGLPGCDSTLLDCETLSQVDEERLTEVFPSISWVFPHPTSRLGARHVLGVCCQWGNCQMRAQAPAPSRAHAHPTIPGERLLKDSDSRNNKGSRIAGVLIRVNTAT